MFTKDADFERADWALLQNGAVNLFCNAAILDEARQALGDLGYEFFDIDCGSLASSFEDQIARALKWQDQFGYATWSGNLDAFNDGMRYFPFGPTGRAALVLNGFHHIEKADCERALAILDIVEAAARDHLLEAKLLIAMVQTDNSNFSYEGIGGRSTNWNRREWLASGRDA